MHLSKLILLARRHWLECSETVSDQSEGQDTDDGREPLEETWNPDDTPWYLLVKRLARDPDVRSVFKEYSPEFEGAYGGDWGDVLARYAARVAEDCADRDQLDDPIDALHASGWTPRLIEELREEYPEFAEAHLSGNSAIGAGDGESIANDQVDEANQKSTATVEDGSAEPTQPIEPTQHAPTSISSSAGPFEAEGDQSTFDESDYKDQGEWLTASYCLERFDFSQSKLTGWAQECPHLDDRRGIRRKKIEGTGKRGRACWCYNGSDLRTIELALDGSEDD